MINVRGIVANLNVSQIFQEVCDIGKFVALKLRQSYGTKKI